MRGRIIQRPAGHSDPAVIIRQGDTTMSEYLYVLPEGSHFATESVDIRKPPAPTLPAPLAEDADEAAQTAHAEATAAAIAEAAAKAKPFRFIPLDASGEKRVKVSRYTLTREQVAAYIAATDAETRTAILSGNEPLETASNVSPTAGQLQRMRALVDKATLAGMLASGILAVPSDRAEKAAKSASGKRAQTEAERTAAALDALFGPDPEPEPEPVPSGKSGK